jgi:hypothetical protein
VEISLNTKTRLRGQRGLVFVFKLISTLINSQNPKLFLMCVEEGCSASLTIALRNKLKIYSI